jgi:hypothetical protein
VPVEFVKRGKEGSYVFVKKGKGKKPIKQKVEVGISDDANIEIISGVGTDDTLVLQTQVYKPSKASSAGSNPFMPSGPKKPQTGRSG